MTINHTIDPKEKIETRKILGLNVDFGLEIDDALKIIEGLINKRAGSHLIATTSPYFVMSAQENKEFMQTVNQAALSVPDGVGVLYAKHYLDKISKLKKGSLFPFKAFIKGLESGIEGFTKRESFGSTITGVDLTYKLCELSSKKGYTMFFLGGRKRDSKGSVVEDNDFDMAQTAAQNIMSLYPNARIIGATSQFSREKFDDNNTMSYIHKCMKDNNVKRIDILLVAYNPIQQELWIQRNANKIPATISMGIGRTFDYISEEMHRPNPIYEKLYISWLYTLIKQPWRMKRVSMSFPIFPLKVFKESIKT
jgi:N-acetylglucosaminyldiphosphoundecaprenol N-acetyl-beta-D-mannosaminyltransferase